MKKLLLASAMLISFSSFAQTAEEKAWMDYMTPGEAHKLLAKDNGTWAADITFYMAPGAEPSTAKATATYEMILDGRYQRGIHKGDMMGMPFEGISTTGYDNARKVYINTFIDNMGTGVMYSEGKYDPAKKAIEFKGKQTDPMTGKTMDFREVIKFIDDNTQEMEMYMTHDGKEFKSMVIKSKRVK